MDPRSISVDAQDLWPGCEGEEEGGVPEGRESPCSSSALRIDAIICCICWPWPQLESS